MPLYAYRCTACGHRFEKIQSFSSEPEQKCPQCSGVLERPLTAPALQFKGGGFYVNDYSGKGSSPKPDAAPPKAETPCAGGACATCPAAAAATSNT